MDHALAPLGCPICSALVEAIRTLGNGLKDEALKPAVRESRKECINSNFQLYLRCQGVEGAEHASLLKQSAALAELWAHKVGISKANGALEACDFEAVALMSLLSIMASGVRVGNPTALLGIIMKNAMISALRKGGKYKPQFVSLEQLAETGWAPAKSDSGLETLFEGQAQADTDADRHELLLRRAREALQDLSRRERELLEGAHFEGLSDEDLAQRYGIERASAKRMRLRALRRLRGDGAA